MAKRTFAVLLLCLLTTTMAHAQAEMADTMRANGKIYVVVAVLATIFAGIFTYLVMLDRKISKAEKRKN